MVLASVADVGSHILGVRSSLVGRALFETADDSNFNPDSYDKSA